MRRFLLAGCTCLTALLLAPVEAQQPDKAIRPGPGLLGRARLDKKDIGIVFRYEHGKVFRHELVEQKFAEKLDKELPRRGLEIVLQGRLHLPKDMMVHARMAGGSVSHGVHTLWINGLEMGSVGDDIQKSQIFKLNFEAGTHRVKWVLRGGRFGNNLLRFEDASTGKLLPLNYSEDDVQEAGPFNAKELGIADSQERGWPIPLDW